MATVLTAPCKVTVTLGNGTKVKFKFKEFRSFLNEQRFENGTIKKKFFKMLKPEAKKPKYLAA